MITCTPGQLKIFLVSESSLLFASTISPFFAFPFLLYFLISVAFQLEFPTSTFATPVIAHISSQYSSICLIWLQCHTLPPLFPFASPPFVPLPSSSRASLGSLFYLSVAFDLFLSLPSSLTLRSIVYAVVCLAPSPYVGFPVTSLCISGFTKLPVAPPR